MSLRKGVPNSVHGARHTPDSRPRGPHVAQPKTPHATRPVAPSAHAPTAPPVYRPQPTPKVLQRKEAVPARTPAPAPKAPRPKQSSGPKPSAAPHRTPSVHAHAQRVVQPLAARVIQAVKFYPNLHPGAVERVEPSSLFRLESFTDQYRLRKTDSHGVYVPNQQYNFVRTVEGSMLLHNRYRHPSIAEGRQVLYAGEAFFNNGRLEWWSNGSGHYQPDADDAAQAALPMDQFYTYQQVIKGEHKRKGGR